MRTRLAHLARLTCLASLILAACASGGSADPSSDTASRILTVVATRATATRVTTTRAAASSAMSSPTASASPTPAEPTATPLPPMVFARCIVRAESPMLREPGDAAQVTAPLRSSDIVTAYGRTADGQWILIWNQEIAFGWIPSGVLGCSAPFEDLRPTEPDVLLTPWPTVTPPALMAGVKTATPASVAAAMTETPTPVVTQTPEPAATETLPTVTGTSTSIPAATEPPVTVTVTITPLVLTPEATAAAATAPAPETATPTVTFTATESPVEPLACIVAINRALNLRAGPDRTTRLLGQLRPGAKFYATGRNTDATWLYGATTRGDFGWVIASAVRCDSDPGGLPVVNGS